ncbi:Cyclin-dependent kinase 2-associated protein [Trichinella pseudospiralis]
MPEINADSVELEEAKRYIYDSDLKKEGEQFRKVLSVRDVDTSEGLSLTMDVLPTTCAVSSGMSIEEVYSDACPTTTEQYEEIECQLKLDSSNNGQIKRMHACKSMQSELNFKEPVSEHTEENQILEPVYSVVLTSKGDVASSLVVSFSNLPYGVLGASICSAVGDYRHLGTFAVGSMLWCGLDGGVSATVLLQAIVDSFLPVFCGREFLCIVYLHLKKALLISRYFTLCRVYRSDLSDWLDQIGCCHFQQLPHDARTGNAFSFVLFVHLIADINKMSAQGPSTSQQKPQTSKDTATVPQFSIPTSQPQSKYSQLLAVIEELGKDIRPTYSGNKMSAERLKRSIIHARILVRECIVETEKAANNSIQNTEFFIFSGRILNLGLFVGWWSV